MRYRRPALQEIIHTTLRHRARHGTEYLSDAFNGIAASIAADVELPFDCSFRQDGERLIDQIADKLSAFEAFCSYPTRPLLFHVKHSVN